MSVKQTRIWMGACCTHGGNEKYEQSSGILHCEVLGIAGQDGKQWQADLNTIMIGTSDWLI